MVHVGPNLLPQRAEQTWSEALVGGVSHEEGQTLEDREGKTDYCNKKPKAD